MMELNNPIVPPFLTNVTSRAHASDYYSPPQSSRNQRRISRLPSVIPWKRQLQRIEYRASRPDAARSQSGCSPLSKQDFTSRDNIKEEAKYHTKPPRNAKSINGTQYDTTNETHYHIPDYRFGNVLSSLLTIH